MTEPTLTQLGQTVQTSPSPSPKDSVLDSVPNPHPGTHYVTRYTCPEFTCVCPVTGQPDFSHLVIDHIPGQWVVESKFLKLYL
jgi:7-cyano-7-deazaguanine reductase